MAADDLPTTRQAIQILERGDAALHALIDPLTPAQRRRKGIGGGEWSPIDLLGHVASWERHALQALEAWRSGARAPIDVALAERGVTGVNADTFAAASLLTPAQVLHRAHRTHGDLLDVIGHVPAADWRRPPLRGGRPLGLRLGSILGSPAGPFRHADAHLPDLRAFVDPMTSA